MFLIDVHDRTYQFRLIGSAVVSRWERDLTGEQIGIGVTPLDDAVSYLSEVAIGRRPVLLAVSVCGEWPHRLRLLLLPLIDRFQRVEMILGGVFGDKPADQVWSRGRAEMREVPIPTDAIDGTQTREWILGTARKLNSLVTVDMTNKLVAQRS